MYDELMACIGKCGNRRRGAAMYEMYFECTEEAKQAKLRDKAITKALKEYHKQDLKRLKILLLGTGESGKSTITKQMKIIHINGFDEKERLSKIGDIKRNIKESIMAMLLGMQQLAIPLDNSENKTSADYVLQNASDPEIQNSDTFLTHCEKLWGDIGVLRCFTRSNEYQLLDCAKYFLDKIGQLKKTDFMPSDQDILRCRVITTAIQNIEFDVPDGGQQVRFSVYDVGGQRGERKKWIQVFDSAAAILFMADLSSFDQSLREDPSKNRLMEALEIFEQVWRNRFLRYVSVILFMNKIDILAEKVCRSHSIADFADQHPGILPEYKLFSPSSSDQKEFLDAFPGAEQPKRKHSSRSASRTDVDFEVIRTACYIKQLFLKIVKGEIQLNKRMEKEEKSWHGYHTCEAYYTCAVDTTNIKKVLDGCRTIIIRKHLERFGII